MSERGSLEKALRSRRDEGRKLLTDLIDFATQPQFVRAVSWKQPGDLVIWDNRCTMHRRDAFDPATRRVMHRTQIKANNPS